MKLQIKINDQTWQFLAKAFLFHVANLYAEYDNLQWMSYMP